MARPVWPRTLLATQLLIAAGACSREAGPRRVLAQELVLKRQIEDLTRLVEVAERGALLPPDELVIAVSEQLVKDVARLALPREQVVAGKFRVRIEKVDVRFRDKHGSVRLDGRVSLADGPSPEVFAELAVFGLIETVELDPRSGVLRGNVSVIGFELARVGVYGESAAGRTLIEELARLKAGALQALALPIEVPVALEREIVLPGLGDGGPVKLVPKRFPLKVTVADVAAHGERLWVALDVALGPWTRIE